MYEYIMSGRATKDELSNVTEGRCTGMAHGEDEEGEYGTEVEVKEKEEMLVVLGEGRGCEHDGVVVASCI
jgi:hypothetical protein